MKILIKNGNVVSNDSGGNNKKDILIDKGKIIKIGNDLDVSADKLIDAENKAVLPGFIDMLCKICESGFENIHNIIILSKAAARGGFTTITASPNTQPVIDNKTVVEYVYSKSREHSCVKILPYGCITKGCAGKEIAEMGEMVLAGAVAISDGGIPVADSSLLRNVMLYSKMFDITIIAGSCDANLAGNGLVNNGYMSTKLGLAGAPSEAEEVALSRNIILAKHTGASLHLSHITTAGSVSLIRAAKKEGVNITSSTCPHYISLSEKKVDNYNTFAKVNPPLRTESDIQALKEGLMDGTIDAIGTGHSPASAPRKKMEFEHAAYGISAIETAFSVVYTNLIAAGFGISDVVRLMSSKPAEILKLKNKGQIKEGYDADIVVADLDYEYTVDSSKFISRAKYSPFDGCRLKGIVTETIHKGICIYERNNS